MNNKDPLLLKSPGTGQEQARQANTGPDNTGKIQERDDAGRFKSGHSGNPSGRPQGAKNIRMRLKDGLAVLGAKDAQGNPLPLEEALSQKMIKMALDGDHKMIQLILYYLEGKPPQSIDITSKGERLEGTVYLGEDADLRIDRIFGFRKLLADKVGQIDKDHANNQRPATESNGSDNRGRTELPENGAGGGTQEGAA